MRDEKVIWREVALVSPAVRDQQLTAILNIELDRHQPHEWAKLKLLLNDAPEVLWCLEVSGYFDVLLIVSVRDMSHFNDFADTLATNPLVRRYQTSFVKRHLKTSTAIVLE